jgi:hypothetical protein
MQIILSYLLVFIFQVFVWNRTKDALSCDERLTGRVLDEITDFEKYKPDLSMG